MITKSRFNADHPPICRRHQIGCFPIKIDDLWHEHFVNRGLDKTEKSLRDFLYLKNMNFSDKQDNYKIIAFPHPVMLETISNCVQNIQFSEN